MATKKSVNEKEIEDMSVIELRALARKRTAEPRTWIAGADRERLIKTLRMSEGDIETAQLASIVDSLAEHLAKMILKHVRKELNNGTPID